MTGAVSLSLAFNFFTFAFTPRCWPSISASIFPTCLPTFPPPVDKIHQRIVLSNNVLIRLFKITSQVSVIVGVPNALNIFFASLEQVASPSNVFGSLKRGFLLKEQVNEQESVTTTPVLRETKMTVREHSTMDNTASLEELQSAEQCRVLDTIAQIRRCGLDTVLSLPQIAVCGDQSAGKSSVLEALTEISFPRADNLCTRFATEIIMRRAATESITIKVIPDAKRPAAEQDAIKEFTDSILDFSELPEVMEKAKKIMGISDGSSERAARAFARDVLSIEIAGPNRPQLSVVDLPGLVQNSTKGVTDADVDLVRELTDHYISQSRTICLAVISATNDYANQGILTKVKAIDPDGNRSLGVITKPDRLPAGSGSEKAYISLANNEDVFFKLGWHVLKNRSFEDGDSDFQARNSSEQEFFAKSNFKELPADSLGVGTLRVRLANILFEHIKRELPRLRDDLDVMLAQTLKDLGEMGKSRATNEECREYLFNLGQMTQETCKAAVNGTYDGDYFKMRDNESLDIYSRHGIRRIRAFVQALNEGFADYLRWNGHTYHILEDGEGETVAKAHAIDSSLRSSETEELQPDSQNSTKPPNPLPATPVTGRSKKTQNDGPPDPFAQTDRPKKISKDYAVKWVQTIIMRNRGRELSGNFNPLVIGELFWRQTEMWQEISQGYIDLIAFLLRKFYRAMLDEYCANDVRDRLWNKHILDILKQREASAFDELRKLIEDVKEHPLNYNHYYTETIAKNKTGRERERIESSLRGAGLSNDSNDSRINLKRAVDLLVPMDPSAKLDMLIISCQDALTCMRAIYKVKSKQFIANVTEQIIERHLIRNLSGIFSPIVVSKMSEKDVQYLVSEPTGTRRQRSFLSGRLAKLKEAETILKSAIGDTGYVGF